MNYTLRVHNSTDKKYNDLPRAKLPPFKLLPIGECIDALGQVLLVPGVEDVYASGDYINSFPDNTFLSNFLVTYKHGTQLQFELLDQTDNGLITLHSTYTVRLTYQFDINSWPYDALQTSRSLVHWFASAYAARDKRDYEDWLKWQAEHSMLSKPHLFKSGDTMQERRAGWH